MDSSSFPCRLGSRALHPIRCLGRLGLIVASALLVGYGSTPTRADDYTQPAGYHVGEPSDDIDTTAATMDSNTDAGAAGDETENGPVRMARFSYISGNVSWRPDENSEWSDAQVNIPLRQGAQIWVTGSGRAEVQFDDGSYLRLGDSAVATLQSLYSDQNGEFTEVRLNDGLASLRLPNDRSEYQVDTAVGAVTAVGPAKVRIGSDTGLEVAVRDGIAHIETENGNSTMVTGDYVYLPTSDDTLVIDQVPGKDAWDGFNDSRDAEIDNPDRPCHKYLPASIDIVADDLDDYGDWHDDPTYGHVWCPRETDSDWRPYEHGHWVWVNPFGWTWVGEERWGWAPYHYGTWIRSAYGWAWVPGPSQQYWSPAVVHFTNCDDNIAWVALAPHEVHYPTVIDAGYRHGNWWTHFSIGGCAVYEAQTTDYCAPRPWHNSDINCGRIVHPVRPIGPSMPITPFVPVNARRGVVVVSADNFAIARRYRPVTTNSEELFKRGHDVDRGHDGTFVAGPVNVRPTRESYTPTRVFVDTHPSPGRLDHPVFRSWLPPAVTKNSDHSGQFVTGRRTDGGWRNGQNWHPGGGQNQNPTSPARTSTNDGQQPAVNNGPVNVWRGGGQNNGGGQQQPSNGGQATDTSNGWRSGATPQNGWRNGGGQQQPSNGNGGSTANGNGQGGQPTGTSNGWRSGAMGQNGYYQGNGGQRNGGSDGAGQSTGSNNGWRGGAIGQNGYYQGNGGQRNGGADGAGQSTGNTDNRWHSGAIPQSGSGQANSGAWHSDAPVSNGNNGNGQPTNTSTGWQNGATTQNQGNGPAGGWRGGPVNNGAGQPTVTTNNGWRSGGQPNTDNNRGGQGGWRSGVQGSTSRSSDTPKSDTPRSSDSSSSSSNSSSDTRSSGGQSSNDSGSSNTPRRGGRWSR